MRTFRVLVFWMQAWMRIKVFGFFCNTNKLATAINYKLFTYYNNDTQFFRMIVIWAKLVLFKLKIKEWSSKFATMIGMHSYYQNIQLSWIIKDNHTKQLLTIWIIGYKIYVKGHYRQMISLKYIKYCSRKTKIIIYLVWCLYHTYIFALFKLFW